MRHAQSQGHLALRQAGFLPCGRQFLEKTVVERLVRSRSRFARLSRFAFCGLPHSSSVKNA